jgi:hypothetical protein
MTIPGLHPWPWKAALCLCAVSLLLLGRQLDFGGYVHADEPNKVHQITQDKYNFNHPLLMLHSVKLYAKAAGISGDYNSVIIAGRWSSVIFSALAIALLVLVTGRLHGVLSGAAAGILILFTPLFYELAHYFKEDPALIFGLSLSLLAMQFYGEKPCLVRAAMLGAACGVAVSAKYTGLIILPFAVYAVFAARRKGDLLTVASFAILIFALINLPMVTSPEVWKSRVDLEVSRLNATNVPNPRKIPHAEYFLVFNKYASPFLLAMIGVYLVGVWKRQFRLSPTEWSMLLLPTFYLVMLCFISTKTERYVLPTSVLFACVAAAGLRPLFSLKHGKVAAGLLLAAAMAWQVPRVYSEDSVFSSKRHEEVLAYLETKLPSSAKVLVDNYQTLEPARQPTPEIRQRTLEPHDTLDSLRRDGFTHILITAKRYPMFSPDSRRASGLTPEQDTNMRSLYDGIFQSGRLVRSWEKGKSKQLEPEFRLYELPQ